MKKTLLFALELFSKLYSSNGLLESLATKLRKKIYLTFLAFLGSVVGLFAQADFVASPASVSVNTGDSFSVILSLETGSDQLAEAAEIHLDFIPSILQVTGVTALSNSGGNNQFPTEVQGAPVFDNTAGTISYAAGNTSSPVVANFQFLQIDFQAIGTTDTSINYVFSFPFRLTDIVLVIDGTAVSVLGAANNIPVTITSANPDPIADFTITPNPAETNEVVTFNGATSSDDG
ncbi:hypothetical protein, partial [Eudoraea sp.]|uniref:hypothetical protein n=1 Tax=Eudoraea sp. TaxID=1979955 RepID=UPI003C78F949